MVMDLGLPDRIAAKDVPVVLVAGWDTRTTNSTGCVCLACLWHHTAGAATGATPSLNTCIYGRGEPNPVPGPLCQVLQSREPNPADDKAYVIAAGRANHAGEGIWGVASGNGETMGVEVEHIGTTTQPMERHEVTARILAAMLEGPGAARSGSAACRHAEYARPLGRKIDFALTDPIDADWMRNRVGFWIGRTIHDIPVPPPEEEDDMPRTRKIAMAASGDVEVETFAYLLPDGTPVDRDYNGSAIDGNDARKFDRILLGDAEKVTASRAEVDQVQEAIKKATMQRHGTL